MPATPAAPETPAWLTPGSTVYVVERTHGYVATMLTPATVVRPTATQVVVDCRGHQRRFNAKTMREVGGSYHGAPRLADPADPGIIEQVTSAKEKAMVSQVAHDVTDLMAQMRRGDLTAARRAIETLEGLIAQHRSL